MEIVDLTRAAHSNLSKTFGHFFPTKLLKSSTNTVANPSHQKQHPISDNFVHSSAGEVPMVRTVVSVARIHASHPSLVSVARIHASHPSLSHLRPPRPPQNVNFDRRDDRDGNRMRSNSGCGSEHKSQSDYESVKSNASFMTLHKRNDHIIQCIDEALSLQKKNLGKDHPSVTRTLHSLALEYKVRGRYDKAVMYLKEALELLEIRICPFSDIVTGRSSDDVDERDAASMDSCESSICASSLESFAASVPLGEAVILHEEQSVIYSCMGNIYTLRGMHAEAADCYVKSVNMLVEADYDGASSRVAMMVRLLKRAEARRRHPPKPHRKPPRRVSGSIVGSHLRRGSSSSFGSTGIKATSSSFETSVASWSSVGQMSV